MKGHAILEIAAGAVILLVAGGFLVYAIGHSGRSATMAGTTLTARFDRVDGLAAGSDVRIAGVRVGSIQSLSIDPQTFQAVALLSVDASLKLPRDSSAEVTSEGLLGGRYVALVPGGDDRILASGAVISNTAGSVNLEQLLGRFIFGLGQAQAPARPGESGDAPRTAP